MPYRDDNEALRALLEARGREIRELTARVRTLEIDCERAHLQNSLVNTREQETISGLRDMVKELKLELKEVCIENERLKNELGLRKAEEQADREYRGAPADASK